MLLTPAGLEANHCLHFRRQTIDIILMASFLRISGHFCGDFSMGAHSNIIYFAQGRLKSQFFCMKSNPPPNPQNPDFRKNHISKASEEEFA